MLKTQEHIELIAMFEKTYKVAGTTWAKKEQKELWPKGIIYCHGETNERFIAYRHGYAFGKCCFQNKGAA